MLGYLAMYFTEFVGLGDHWSGIMVGALTWGITFSMFFLGEVSDRWGVRRTLLLALSIMLVGRAVMAAGSYLGLESGLWSPLHLVTMAGIFFIVIGYGMYQPAAYSAVRAITTPATATMGYAMLYAVMNLGGWLPSFFSPVRRAVGINGTFWVFSGLTLVGLALTAIILTKKAIADATAAAQREKTSTDEKTTPPAARIKEPFSLGRWLKTHPFKNLRFTYFVFCLIPVQTLFAHNWLTLPLYVKRAFSGSAIGENFEFAVNFNPLLIFLLVPLVAAITAKRKVYNMMILGTLVMAAPTFLLALGPKPIWLFSYLIIMTIGEAMWQPRFLQYAAEIAPEGETGKYMGVAQFPWFLTKAITPLYSGWFLANYCPEEGPLHTETMWLIYGAIAMTSTFFLLIAKSWLGKEFKTTSD
jgi:MFS family permease